MSKNFKSQKNIFMEIKYQKEKPINVKETVINQDVRIQRWLEKSKYNTSKWCQTCKTNQNGIIKVWKQCQ